MKIKSKKNFLSDEKYFLKGLCSSGAIFINITPINKPKKEITEAKK